MILMKHEIPLLFGRPKDKALFNAKEYLKSTKSANIKIDEAIIFFSRQIAIEAEKSYKIKIGNFDTENPCAKTIKINGKKILFTKSVIGASACGTMLEEIIAMGAKRIISIGSAGTLQDTPIGELIIPTRAIRDEGTSYHYLTPGKYSYPSKKLVKKITQILKSEKINYKTGTTWTTDSPYRETYRKIRKYKKEKVETVEMEASALFAIGKARKIDIASIFWISDNIGRKKWNHAFFTKHYNWGAKRAFNALKKYLER